MTDQSLKPNDNHLVNYRGRSRRLIATWEEMRRARNRLWLNTCPTLGHGRAATLVLLSEMVEMQECQGLDIPNQWGGDFMRHLTIPMI